MDVYFRCEWIGWLSVGNGFGFEVTRKIKLIWIGSVTGTRTQSTIGSCGLCGPTISWPEQCLLKWSLFRICGNFCQSHSSKFKSDQNCKKRSSAVYLSIWANCAKLVLHKCMDISSFRCNVFENTDGKLCSTCVPHDGQNAHIDEVVSLRTKKTKMAAFCATSNWFVSLIIRWNWAYGQ